MSGSDVIRSRKAIIGAGMLATLALLVAMMFAVIPQAGADATKITDEMIEKIADQKYTGSKLEPSLTVKNGTTPLVLGTDYTVTYSDNVDVTNSATATVTGIGAYEGNASRTFSIVPKDFSTTAVIADIENQTFTAKEIEPTLAVKDGTFDLVEGKDYTVTYTNNVNKGTSAKATIAGMGNYEGNASKTFEIVEEDITKATIAAEDQEYTGSALTTTVTVTLNDVALKEGVDFQVIKYYNNTEVGLATVVVQGIGNLKGETVAHFNIIDGSLVTMYRVYNPNSGEHFYTASVAERDHLVEVGWKDEGIGWYAPETSATPVYRLYNPNVGDHHYTTSSYERDELVKAGWNDEGTGWYSDDAETVPVLRQYNPNAKAGAHNFTTSQAENDYLVSVGWNAEGTGWYAVKAA